MQYRQPASVFGVCDRHSETAALGACAACGSRLCEDCAAFETVSIHCHACAHKQKRRLLWRRLGQVVRAAMVCGIVGCIVYWIEASWPPQAQCLSTSGAGVLDCPTDLLS